MARTISSPALAVPLLVWIVGPPAQAPAPPPAEAAPAPDPLQPGPDAARVERTFAATPEATHAALLDLLHQEGLTLEPTSTDSDLVTEMTLFPPDRYGPMVAKEPPPISPAYPFYQKREMNTGKFQLHVHLEPAGGGCRVRIEAAIVAEAFNRATYEHAEIPRESNGTIEKHFADALAARLQPGTPQTAPSH
jgi:hypothetical protein